MKKLALIVFGSLLLAGFASAEEASRIAVVNMDTVFNKYYKTELADKQLKEQAEEFNSQRKEMLDRYEEIQQTFTSLRDESQNPAISEDVRTAKRDQLEERMIEIRELERKIRRFEETHQKQLQEQSLRMRKKIVSEMREEISTIANKGGYNLVLDTSGQSLNAVEFVLYSKDIKDLTDDVLAALNKGKREKVGEDEKEIKKELQTLKEEASSKSPNQVLKVGIGSTNDLKSKSGK